MSASRYLRTAGLAVCAAFVAGPAAADAIDGDWCYADGRHLSINGPRIVTPAGNAITGDYDRHAFIYTVPSPEADAGTRIFMVMRDEHTIYLSAHAWPGSADAAATQTWIRCAGPIS